MLLCALAGYFKSELINQECDFKYYEEPQSKPIINKNIEVYFVIFSLLLEIRHVFKHIFNLPKPFVVKYC